MKALTIAACIGSISACILPADDRTRLDLEVGVGAIAGVEVQSIDGLAQIMTQEEQALVVWAQAPSHSLFVTTTSARSFSLIVRNCMPGSVLEQSTPDEPEVEPIVVPAAPSARPTQCLFSLNLPAGKTLVRIAPPEADADDPFRVVIMGDIQTALGTVDDVFQRINDIPDARFVLCTGDIVQDGHTSEYDLYFEQLETLELPIYSTIGNHELASSGPEEWHERVGRFSIHFRFHQVFFSFVDSGNASIDPGLYARIQDWLEVGRDHVHLFGTHYPPFDPVGARGGAFRSRKEAAKLLSRLAGANIDATFYGHIHSYYAYSNAGMPAYISGGGGALPERFDGIGRHVLSVDIDPKRGIEQVAVVRIDPR